MFNLRALFHKNQAEQEMDDELRFHLEKQIEQNIANDMTPEEARYAALRQFGNVGEIKEECRDTWGVRFINELGQELRYGLRQIRRNPGFTAVAVLALALGIGANTAIFSVVNAVLLRPLPYPGANRMVVIHESLPKAGALNDSWPDYLDWRAQNHVFEDITALQLKGFKIRASGAERIIPGASVSRSFFSLFGVKLVLGRAFNETENRPGAEDVAVVSYSFWQNTLKGDKSAIGKTIQIDDQPTAVIGVLPPSFSLPYGRLEVYLPIGLEANAPGMTNRGNHPGLSVIAKLRPGTSLEEARTEMNTIMDRLGREYPTSNRNETAVVTPLIEQLVGKTKSILIMLLGAAGFVLLLACANVAHMALARSATRLREFALRAALGASRGRVFWQQLIQSLPLAVLGGGAGLALAALCTRPFVHMYPGRIFRLSSTHLDGSVLLFAALVCLLTWVLFGLAPAVDACRRRNIYALVKSGGYGNDTLNQRRLRSALFAAEIAIALVVTIAAGLLLRSLVAVINTDPGFHADHVLFLGGVQTGHTGSPQQNLEFWVDALGRVSHLPGVRSASAALSLPLSGALWTSPYAPNAHPPSAGTQLPWTQINVVMPGYFRTMGIQLMNGRFFNNSDDENSKPVAVVSQTMARSILGHGGPLGRHIYVQYSPHALLEVIGVVNDVKQFGLDRPDVSEVYLPATQVPMPSMNVIVHTSVNPKSVAHEVLTTVHNLSKSQPLPRVGTMGDLISAGLADRKFVSLLVGLFGSLALFLAAVGVSGVVNYTVVQRTHEIGIRMALGAERKDVLKMVVGQGLKLALIGVAIGIAGALALTRFLSSLLYGVKPTDPLTFIAVSLVLIAMALVACYIPARRAARVDPMVALRYE